MGKWENVQMGTCANVKMGKWENGKCCAGLWRTRVRRNGSSISIPLATTKMLKTWLLYSYELVVTRNL
jgi:hypothetical protein